MSVQVLQGDCIQVMKALADNSVDAIVTDPPYELGFMGRKWDASGIAYNVSMWAECLRVLKPGGHLLAFGGTRTYHRMACAIEDAGFEIRDSLHWIYGSGFPKSLDVSKAIDKAAGAQREVTGSRDGGSAGSAGGILNMNARDMIHGSARDTRIVDITAPATEEAVRWEGWGTALKPAHEPVIWARKPFNVVSFDWRLVANVHHAISGLLWLSLSPAKHVEIGSPSSPHGQREVMCVSALVNAALDSSRGKSEATDMFSSPELESIFWSTVSSWSNILDALSDSTRTSTISTASSTTTALRILNSLLAPVTSLSSMPWCGCLLAGEPQPAGSAEKSSSGDWQSWLHTLKHSVPGNAFSATATAVTSALAGIAEEIFRDQEKGSSARKSATINRDESSPAHEPIVLARKPLTGTVAANVLEHGTGALNIDGCRVEGIKDTPASPRRAPQNAAYGELGNDPGTGSGWDPNVGRWPPNILLTHDPECIPVGIKMIQGDNRKGGAGKRPGGFASTGADSGDPEPNGPLYGDSRIEAWKCVPGCPIAEMDGQTGVLKSGSNNFIKNSSADFEGNTGAAYGAESRKAGTEMVSYGDSGGASRFFPCFKGEQACALYGMLSVCEYVSNAAAKFRPTDQLCDSVVSDASVSQLPQAEDKAGSSKSSAHIAEPASVITQATSDNIVPRDASTKSSAWSALLARSAENLCASCAIVIARSAVATQLGRSVVQELGLPSTGDFSEQILNHSLVLFAASLENHDTISTTTDLMTSLGCVVDAISMYIIKASQQAEKKSAQPCMKYNAKAKPSERPKVDGINHPTVKPVSLMQWLVRLVTPSGGIVLDPFAGSGTTGEACLEEGFNSILIERELDYIKLIKARLDAREPTLWD